MEQSNSRSAQEVLEEHLKLSSERKDEEELWRNVRGLVEMEAKQS